MRKRIMLAAVLCLAAAWAVQAGEWDRIAFKSVDALAISCETAVPGGVNKKDFEKSIEDLVFITLKSKLPKIKINNSAPCLVVLAIDTFDNKMTYMSSMEIQLQRIVFVEGEPMPATVYVNGFNFGGPLPSFESHSKQLIEKLLAAFIADFYKARPDL